MVQWQSAWLAGAKAWVLSLAIFISLLLPPPLSCFPSSTLSHSPYPKDQIIYQSNQVILSRADFHVQSAGGIVNKQWPSRELLQSLTLTAANLISAKGSKCLGTLLISHTNSATLLPVVPPFLPASCVDGRD